MACNKCSINVRFLPTSICFKFFLFNLILLNNIQNVWNVYTSATFLDIKNKSPESKDIPYGYTFFLPWNYNQCSANRVFVQSCIRIVF